METADGIPVVHCVESRNLVYTHRRHFQDPGDLIHNADARETVLSLSEIEKRHHGRLLVLRGVPGEDLVDEFLILGCEFEGDLGVIFGGIAMLRVV